MVVVRKEKLGVRFMRQKRTGAYVQVQSFGFLCNHCISHRAAVTNFKCQNGRVQIKFNSVNLIRKGPDRTRPKQSA